MAKKEQKEDNKSCNVGVLDNGMVVIQFATPIREMAFSPEQAIQLGVGFIQAGTRGESLQRVSPPGRTQQGPRRVV